MNEHQTIDRFKFDGVIDMICDFGWHALTESETTHLAWAYYYFSIQFRENLETAIALYPDDERLRELERGECDTDNLSPWPGVAAAGERMHHDEFMRRALCLIPVTASQRQWFEDKGARYLARVRQTDPMIRAMSLASYEDGGLERVFRAMLRAPLLASPPTRAFRHFLAEHIRFDSDSDAGHGALIRHLRPDDRIFPLWDGFRCLLLDFIPTLTERDRSAA